MRAYILPKDMIWNVFLKAPRNEPCPCGSGVKFKRCHLPNLPRLLDPKALMEAYEADLKAKEDQLTPLKK